MYGITRVGRSGAHKQLPILKAALAAYHDKHVPTHKLKENLQAAWPHQPATLILPGSTKRGARRRTRSMIAVINEVASEARGPDPEKSHRSGPSISIRRPA
jgi:hypothetical protein